MQEQYPGPESESKRPTERERSAIDWNSTFRMSDGSTLLLGKPIAAGFSGEICEGTVYSPDGQEKQVIVKRHALPPAFTLLWNDQSAKNLLQTLRESGKNAQEAYDVIFQSLASTKHAWPLQRDLQKAVGKIAPQPSYAWKVLEDGVSKFLHSPAAEEQRYIFRTYKGQFIDDALALKYLDGAGAPQFLDLILSPDLRDMIVMEKISGDDLSQLILHAYERKEQFPPIVAAVITEKLLTLIGRLHAPHERLAHASIFYGDIKPQNIMLRGVTQEADLRAIDPEATEVVLVDYGSVHVGHELTPYQGINYTGELPIHTRNYSAPEFSLEGPLVGIPTIEGDIYAAGIVLLEMLLGTTIYDFYDKNIDLWKHFTLTLGNFKPTVDQAELELRYQCSQYFLKDIRAALVQINLPLLADVVSKALDPNPQNRFHSAREMQEALAHVRDEASTSS